jgi:uncharacterized protein
VIVPLLVLWFGYNEKAAAATSLAAIVFIAAFGASVQVAFGHVNPADAALVGLPALAGVLAGTWLQQRVPARTIAVLFALILAASAVQLVLR